jgi:hypothetical protein
MIILLVIEYKILRVMINGYFDLSHNMSKQTIALLLVILSAGQLVGNGVGYGGYELTMMELQRMVAHR